MNPDRNGKAPEKGKVHTGIAIFGAAVLTILAYPTLGMLWYHDYPLITAESALILLAFMVSALFVSLLFKPTRATVRNLGLSVLITLAFLVHFNLFFLAIIAVFAVSLVLGMLLSERFPQFLLAVFCALIVGSWLDNQLNPSTELAPSNPTSADADEGPGPVIHLLLDGFIAPDGLPGGTESGNLRDEVISFFARHGFDLHTKAYSHYHATLDSMTRSLNFRNDDANLFMRASLLHSEMTFGENRWFGILDSAGYDLNVYQTESMDYCNVESGLDIRCNTFPMPYLRTIHRDLPNPVTRAQILMRTLVSQSMLMTKILRKAKLMGTWGVSVYDERLLPTLTSDVVQQRSGAYFAHVLIPHSPQLFREDCSIDYSTESWIRWNATSGLIGNSEETRRKKYEKMLPQFRCALKLLDGLFETLRTNGLYEKSTIIVHGDHGTSAYLFSPSVYNLQHIYQRDLLESFSTLYAVKRPYGEFHHHDEVKSLNVLLAKSASQLTGKSADELGIEVASEEEPFIYLTGSDPMKKMIVNIFNKPGEKAPRP